MEPFGFRMGTAVAAVGCLLAVVSVAGCTTSKDRPYRMRHTLDGDRLGIECDGDFEQPPQLTKGKAPVFPISMLNPTLIEDRKTRHLPMRWDMRSQFTVDVDGVPRQVQSTKTDPPSFGRHANAAISEWRFQPAMRAGAPVAAQCLFVFHYALS